MDHGDDTRAVQVAKLEGRLEGIERALSRQEESCERRANSHVDIRLYESERNATRSTISTIHAEVAQVRMDLESFRKQLTDQRRWVIGVVIIPILGAAVAVLMGLLS